MNTFRPSQAQLWSLTEAFTSIMGSSYAKTELRLWSWLGLMSLSIAGVFALLLAISRVPNSDQLLSWPIHFFEKGLIIHVIFSFVIWFLSIFSALCTISTYRLSNGRPRLQSLGYIAIALAVTAFILLFLSGLMNRGAPSLNNYIPVIIDPIYYSGLGIFFFSTFLQFFRLIINFFRRRGPFEPVTQAIMVAGILFLIAIYCFFHSLSLVWGDPIDPALNENIFWASGHVLQFVNTLLMLVSWYILGSIIFGQPVINPKIFSYILWAFLFSGAGLLFILLSYDPISAYGRDAFTKAQFLMLPLVLSFFLGFALNLSTLTRNNKFCFSNDPVTLTVCLSMVVFLIGGFLGLFVDGNDTRTPAHYHGVIGGVNIAFIGFFFFFMMPILRQADTHRSVHFFLLWCYGVGQILHSLGLFFAGGYGAPRKTPGNLSIIDNIWAEASLYAMGIGAVIAVLGGVLFIVTAGKMLLNTETETTKSNH